ncbi:MAG: hypothetical protein PHT41_03980 [Candidatus Omnitrophica bacterium]|nr:hypothetical protein [Candidatus Omnitrophota bacterium]
MAVKFHKNKEIVLRIFIVCITTLLVIALLEIILRIYPVREITVNNPYQYIKTKGQARFGIPFNTYAETFPLKFDSRGYYRKSSGIIGYHFNQFGGRWLEPAEQKLGRRNIIVIGDSFTYGFGLRYEDTYIYKIQDSLNKSGLNVSFINFSRPGCDSEMCLTIYNRIKDTIHHDCLIYGLDLNDLIEFPISYILSNRRGCCARIRRYSKLMDFIFVRVGKIKHRQENIRGLIDPSNFEKSYFIKNIEAIKQINIEAQRRSIKFLVVILPILTDLRDCAFCPVYKKIKEQFGINKIAYFDLTDSVCSYQDPDLWIFPFDQHPNEVANTIYARKLEGAIKNILLDSKD